MILLIIRIILIILFLSAIYIAVFSSRIKMIKAEAGGIVDASGTKSKITYSIRNILFNKDNQESISYKNIIPFEVEGDCMEYVGIYDGDVMYARKIKSVSEIKLYDILLIKVKNNAGKTVYKIRMVEDIINKDKGIEFRTFYFINKDGECYKKISSKNHKFNQILGIVCYKEIIKKSA